MHLYDRLWRPVIATIFATALASCGASSGSGSGSSLADTSASATAAVAQKPSTTSIPDTTSSKASDADVHFAP